MKVPTKVGSYHLRPIIKCGAGRYGVVLRATHDTITTRKDVVKLIPIDRLIKGYRGTAGSGSSASNEEAMTPQEVDKEAFRHVIDEANRAAKLDHPNVVKIRDAGIEEDDRLGWIAMEFVAGGTLWKRLKALISSKKMLPLKEALRYIEQIASGVAWMHANRMVHGDLKEDNILLAPVFGKPSVFTAKITDFSVLRSFSQRPVPQNAKPTKKFLTQTQAEDVKAIATMAYRLIAGANVPKDLNSWFSEPIWRTLSRIRQLQWVIGSGLEAPTTLAYSAEQLRDGIQAYRTVNIPPGYPASRVERFTTLFQRRPVAAPIVSSVAIAFVVGAAIIFSLYAKTQLQDAEAKGLKKDNQQAQKEKHKAQDDLEDNKKTTLETLRKIDRKTVQRTFEILQLHRHVRADAPVPPAQLEPVERALADQLRGIEKELESSPIKDEARPWLDLCKAQLALIKDDYKGVVNILAVDPPKQPAPDPLEIQRIYHFYKLRGIGHFGQSQYNAAVSDFAKALDANPNSPIAWTNLGRAQVEARKLPEGIQALTKAKEKLFARPKQVRDDEWRIEASVFFSLGRAYTFQEQPAKAISPLAEAVAYWDEPNLPMLAASTVGLACSPLGNRPSIALPARFLATDRSGRPHDSFFADCNIDLAVAYGRLQNHKKAQVYADKAVATYRDLKRIAPLPDAVKVNYAIALLTSVMARNHQYDLNSSVPDATEAIDIPDSLHEKKLLAQALHARNVAYFRQSEIKIRGVRAATIALGGLNGFATYSPTHWLANDKGVHVLLPTLCADAIADAKHSIQVFHNAGSIADEAQARLQLVADYRLCGDLANALAEVKLAVPLFEKTKNKTLLDAARRMQKVLEAELGVNRVDARLDGKGGQPAADRVD